MNIMILILYAILLLTKFALSDTLMPTPWENISCTDPVYANQSLSANTRWNYADTSQAWSAAIINWQKLQYQGSTLYFSQSIAQYFGSPVNVECGDTNLVGTCSQYSTCVNPAAYDAILSSLAFLHDFYANFIYDIVLALQSLQTSAAQFSITFGLQMSQVQSNDNTGLIEAIAVLTSMTIGVAFTGFFSVFGEVAKTLKDIINPLAVGAVIISNEQTASEIDGDPWKAFASLESFLGTILNPVINATEGTLSYLFSGSATAIYQLQTLISNGLIFSKQNPSVTAMVNTIKLMMYGYITPVAWTTSNENICPFVLDYGQDFGLGCPPVTYFDNFASAKTCYNGRTYFLLNANGISSDGSRVFALLPGTGDLLAGTYGITLDNIIHGAVNTYISNNNKNEAPILNGTDPSVVESFMSGQGVEQAGLIRIPVCPASLIAPCCSYYPPVNH